MMLENIYGSSVTGKGSAEPQDVAQPASTDRDTSPKAPTMADHAVAISWLGIVLALILLRIVYEVSE